ncbi:MAG TPA: hypothetical protein VFO56_04065 [Gaiellaceae bacterium]|nr:hypothetical protein [Gaiellaceae bacterium]
MKLITRRWAVLGATAILAASITAGGVIAAQLTTFENPDRLAKAIEKDPLVLAADIPAAGGAARHSVLVQETSTGHICLWDVPSATPGLKQGGCNSADDPLAGRPLSVSFSYDGGPAMATVRDARLIGLTTANVATVEVVMNDGTRRPMRLEQARVGGAEYFAFGYRFKAGDLRRGIGPVAVVAFDDSGVEIDRQTTGFTG